MKKMILASLIISMGSSSFAADKYVTSIEDSGCSALNYISTEFENGMVALGALKAEFNSGNPVKTVKSYENLFLKDGSKMTTVDLIDTSIGGGTVLFPNRTGSYDKYSLGAVIGEATVAGERMEVLYTYGTYYLSVCKSDVLVRAKK